MYIVVDRVDLVTPACEKLPLIIFWSRYAQLINTAASVVSKSGLFPGLLLLPKRRHSNTFVLHGRNTPE